MDGNKRREAIIDLLKKSKEPVSGTYLAKTLQVSRQIIVQDIALLRASHQDIACLLYTSDAADEL